jgi:hypothetical protein
VAHSPVDKQWLCKQQTLLGNARYIHARNNRTTVMKPVSRQRISKQAFTTMRWSLETVFSVRSVQNCYKEDNGGGGDPFNWGMAVSWALQWKLKRDDAIVELGIEGIDLRDIRQTIKACAGKLKNLPLLTSVTKKRLLKALRAGEDLVFAAVICKVCRSAIAL